MVEVIRHQCLRDALDAARAEAQLQPLAKTEIADSRPSRRGEERRRPWAFVPDGVFMARARHLLRRHGLELDWLGTKLNERGQVETSWRLRFPPTSEAEIYPYQAPIMGGLETQTHGVLGTTHHARRSVLDLLLDIPQVDRAPEVDRVADGVIVGPPARPTPTPPEVERELDEQVGEMPTWPPEEGGGGLVDPGPLGGDVEDETRRAGEVLQEPRDTSAVDDAALRAALSRRGKRLQLPPGDMLTSALRAAHPGVEGVDWSRALRPDSATYADERARLVDFLQREGDLP